MKRQLTFLLAILWLYRPVTGHTQDRLTSFIDSLMTAELKPDRPGGVVLVAKKGKIVYEKAFGMADLQYNIPMRDDMVFQIGSNTKQFTAVAILQLYEKGKLSLDDTLGKYLSCSPPVGAITIRQLLAQTSGLLEDDRAPSFDLKDRKDLTDREKQVYPSLNASLRFTPGTRWEYCNQNYQALGVIIEKVTGRGYGDYITENIFQPAGMTHTYMSKEQSIVPGRATGYFIRLNGEVRNWIGTHPDKIYAAGGIESTVEDMFRWNRALKAGILLKSATLQEAWTAQRLADGRSTGYGLGWNVDSLHDSPVLRHGGGTPGFCSETLFFPREDVFVVFLQNAYPNPTAHTAMSRLISGVAIGKPYDFMPVPIHNDSLQRYTGRYALKGHPDNTLAMIAEKDTLFIQMPDGHRANMTYMGHGEFRFETYWWVQFTTDTSGKMDGLIRRRLDLYPDSFTRISD